MAPGPERKFDYSKIAELYGTGASQRDLAAQFGITGFYNFCETLGAKVPRPRKHSSIYRLDFSKKESLAVVLPALYENSKVFLGRKRKVYQQWSDSNANK